MEANQRREFWSNSVEGSARLLHLFNAHTIEARQEKEEKGRRESGERERERETELPLSATNTTVLEGKPGRLTPLFFG